MTFDKSYTKILKEILDKGTEKENRTGINTLSIFNREVQHETSPRYYNILPISNARKIHWKGALIETLWLLGLHMNDGRYSLSESTNTKYLEDHGVNYWKPWADNIGNLGPVYGKQLVDWNGNINQIQNIIDTLRTNPDDRRLVATMWNPGELGFMALPPCHHTMEFYSEPFGKAGKRRLHIRWMQRSCDMPIGVPYDVLLYTFINHIVAMCTGHVPGNVYGLLGDCHIYVNQIDGVKEILSRMNSGEVLECTNPYLEMSDRIKEKLKAGMLDLSDFNIDGSDFIVKDYNPLSTVKMPVAI